MKHSWLAQIRYEFKSFVNRFHLALGDLRHLLEHLHIFINFTIHHIYYAVEIQEL